MTIGAGASLFRSWTAADPAPAYLLAGEGARLSELLGEALETRFRREGQTVERVHWTAADLERQSPVAALRSPSFFFRRRIFQLPDAAEWKQGPRKEILEYLAAPDPSVVLVIPCAERKTERLFAPVRGIRSTSPAENDVAAAMADYAVSRAAEDGKEMSRGAALFLARWVEADFPRLKAEMAKLLAYAASRETIGEEEIRQVCVAGGGVDPFRLAADLIARNRTACIEGFRRFAAGAEPAEYHALVGAIAWAARRRIAWSVQRSQGAGRGRSGGVATAPGAREAAVLSTLARIDADLKGASGLTPEQVFEIRLLKLLA